MRLQVNYVRWRATVNAIAQIKAEAKPDVALLRNEV